MLSLLISVALADLIPQPEICNGVDDDFNGLIDDGAACTGCTTFQGLGSAYTVCDGPFLGWADAQSTCTSMGYHLIDVGSMTEQDLVVPFFVAGTSYWNSVNDLTNEGDYLDSTGDPIPFSVWDTGTTPPQPQGGTAENCVLFYRSATLQPYAWHDASCTSSESGAVCEAECQLLTFYEDDDGDGYGTGPAYTGCGPLPGSAATQSGDCDDNRSAVYPGATERCNGLDDDCDGNVDEGFVDGDGDGLLDCQGDCDDQDASVYAGATESCDGRDEDCDGLVDEGFDADGDGYTSCGGDCDDGSSSRWPGAAEIADGIDDDCDGDAFDGLSFYADLDGDGFGDPTTSAGAPFSGSVTQAGDCDDRAALRSPVAIEICNGVDDDCDGWADEGDTCGADCLPFDTPSGRYLRCTGNRRFFEAVDDCRSMGWEVANATSQAVEDDIVGVIRGVPYEGWWHGGVDIGEEDVFTSIDGGPTFIVWQGSQPNDQDAGQDCVVYTPTETHDRKCNDNEAMVCAACDSVAWFIDLDGDGVGAGEPVYSCERPGAGLVRDSGDCDDGDSAVWKGAAEVCDGVDNDCDGSIDEGPAIALIDGDGDGYGDLGSGTLVEVCGPIAVLGGDCADGDDSVWPGQLERCNGIDDDCDGFVDEEGCSCEVVQDGAFVHQFCVGSSPKLSWPDAQDRCAADGYRLAMLDTSEVDRYVGIEAFARSNNSFWFGMEEVGGVWTWVDGTPVDNLRFANTQPSGNGTCGHLWAGGSQPRWNDYPCDSVEDWICEADCTAVTLYRDGDGDGDGDPSVPWETCGGAVGWSSSATDCDDADGSNSARFAELCDGVDNDCDGVVDNGLVFGDWFLDADGDGFGDDTTVLTTCDPPTGWVAVGGDCDDASEVIFPGGPEFCDGLDENCNGLVDEDASDGTPGFLDLDGDGYGDDATAGAWCAGVLPAEYTGFGGDCDDTNAAISPEEREVCSGVDDDCDGLVDDLDSSVDPASFTDWYPDVDVDGFGDASAEAVRRCEAPRGKIADSTDCDDSDAQSFPGAIDIPGDGVDQNCDGVDTAPDADTDGDGLLDVDEIALGSSPIDADTDGDGVRDPDEVDPGPVNRDTDGDGIPDHSDPDDDGDGVDTIDELTTDTDGDGLADYLDVDSDGDGALDGAEGDGDSDGDGVIDRLDPGGSGGGPPPPDVGYGCGCSSSGRASVVWVLGLLLYRRSRLR